jgi:VWFA-related protein
MRAVFIAGAVAACALSTFVGTATQTDLVELGVVAVDRMDRPVADLRRNEFILKEDGEAVDIKTFAHVTLSGTAADDGRMVTLLLDDIGVPISGSSAMRAIARVVLEPALRGDELSVVRLSSRVDEPFGDAITVHDRIQSYHGGVVPFSRTDTPQTVLEAVAKIAYHLEATEHRRKAIICLGLPTVCDVEEPSSAGANRLWPYWVRALAATARANVAVYCIDPTGLNRSSGARGVGLVRLTGGEVFSNSNDFARAAHAIWADAADYYLLGYWPREDGRELRSIAVSIARKDVRVRVRARRGV